MAKRTGRAPKTKRKSRHYNTRPRGVTLASSVRITRADGTVEIQPALTPKQLRELIHDRIPFTERQKATIRKRDRDTCRYCGGGGPFEFDHVVPVALGGVTSVRNGVLACVDCNRRKGSQVWTPRPLR